MTNPNDTMLSNLYFSSEFKDKRERWRDSRGRMKPIDENKKRALEKSIKRGEDLVTNSSATI